MRFYFRLARGVGVSLPWWLAIIPLAIWAAGLVLVGGVYLVYGLALASIALVRAVRTPRVVSRAEPPQ